MSRATITYENLLLTLGTIMARATDVLIIEETNQHGTISLSAIIDGAKREKVLHENPTTFAVFYMEEEKPVSIFHGVITGLEIVGEGSLYYLNLEAKTATYFMDFSPRIRSFQDMDATSHELIHQVMKEYQQSKTILNIPDMKVNEFVFQYEETCWNFLKRFVSRYGTKIFVNSGDIAIRLQVGLSGQKSDIQWDDLSYEIHQDLEEINDRSENRGAGEAVYDGIRYIVTTYEFVSLGNLVIFHEREMYIGKIRRRMLGGLMVHEYTLFFANGLTIQRYHNPLLAGVSVCGLVNGVMRNKVRVKLMAEEPEKIRNAYWFLFSTVSASSDGSGWYSMPRIGDRVRVFFPISREQEGYAITSGKGSSSGKSKQEGSVKDPDRKDIRTPDGKEVSFTLDGIVLKAGGKGEIFLANSGSVMIGAVEDISMNAETIQFMAQKELKITAEMGGKLGTDSGASMNLSEEEIQLYGSKIHQNVEEGEV